VFPLCNRRRPVDPMRPVTNIKTAWTAVRVAAGIECRFHDMRHTAYTDVIEDNVPDGVISAVMGHISKEMEERYSHVRMSAMRKAVNRDSQPNPNPPLQVQHKPVWM
jgi:integrase